MKQILISIVNQLEIGGDLKYITFCYPDRIINIPIDAYSNDIIEFTISKIEEKINSLPDEYES